MFFRKIFRCNIVKITKGNQVKIKGLMKGARISINGKGNVCMIEEPVTNIGLAIFVQGNHNSITVEKGCVLKNLSIWIEDDHNKIFIGKDTLICGQTKLSCIEGTKIIIGERCLFSDGIEVRTGDAHSILDENGTRINPSLDVKLDGHIWVGHGATVLKGVHIAKDSIVGAQSVVTKKFEGGGLCNCRKSCQNSQRKHIVGCKKGTPQRGCA